MSLAKDRKTDELVVFDVATPFEFPVAATAKLYGGALACLDSAGNVVRGAASTSLIAVGRCEKLADNTSGSAGDIKARVKPGIFKWANSGATIDATHKGLVCYIVDDESVALTDGGGARSKAGVVVDVESDGVWVATGFNFFSSPAATPSGTLQKKTVTIPYDLAAFVAEGDDGDAVDVNVGTALPADAILVAARYEITTPFAGAGLATLTMMVGFAGDTNGVIEAVDILGDAAAEYRGVPGTAMGGPAPLKQLVANFDPDASAGLDELTAGSVTIDVYYFVAF